MLKIQKEIHIVNYFAFEDSLLFLTVHVEISIPITPLLCFEAHPKNKFPSHKFAGFMSNNFNSCIFNLKYRYVIFQSMHM